MPLAITSYRKCKEHLYFLKGNYRYCSRSPIIFLPAGFSACSQHNIVYLKLVPQSPASSHRNPPPVLSARSPLSSTPLFMSPVPSAPYSPLPALLPATPLSACLWPNHCPMVSLRSAVLSIFLSPACLKTSSKPLLLCALLQSLPSSHLPTFLSSRKLSLSPLHPSLAPLGSALQQPGSRHAVVVPTGRSHLPRSLCLYPVSLPICLLSLNLFLLP